MKKLILLLVGIAATGWASCQAQPANLSPGLQEIVKLTQAHLSDDVIVSYIRNSGAAYTLSADDILYLNSQGVSQPVLSELLHSKPSAPTPAPPQNLTATPAPAPPVQVASTIPNEPPPSAPPMVAPPTVLEGGAIVPSTPAPVIGATPPPDSEVNLAYFQGQLGPSGQWIDIPGYGQCWRPGVVAQNPDWRPYFDDGHWVYTEDGWTWQSTYAWGDIAFHYGRWFRDPSWGWMWLPGYNWGPAWVSWRHAEGVGFCGWAPLPPAARFDVGVGLSFNGRFGVDLDFGLGADAFCFVPFDHFWAPDYHLWVAPVARVDVLFHASVVLNGYSFVGGRFVVEGIGRDRMALLTHHAVVVERVGIHDERIARSREMQHVHSQEVRRVISHDEAARQRQDIHQDVRRVEATHHDEAVRRYDTSRQPQRGGSQPERRSEPSREGDRNRENNR